MNARARERCGQTWGLFDRARCKRKQGHDGMHTAVLKDGRKIAW